MAFSPGTYRWYITSADLDSLETLDIEEIINIKMIRTTTALIFSLKQDNLDIVKFLLKVNGINVNIVDTKGRSALHWAANNRSKDAVKLLLKMPDIQVIIISLALRSL